MKDYNFNEIKNDLDVLSPEQSQFYLTDNGNILSVTRKIGSTINTPFGNEFARESHREFDYEAYSELFENFYQKTQWALLDKVTDAIWKDHVATKEGNDVNITFNSIKTLDDQFEVKLNVSSDVYDHLTPEKLVEMVREDLYYYNDDQSLEFCALNNIDVNDIVIFAKDEIMLSDEFPGVVVVAIENIPYENCCDIPLSELTDEDRKNELSEQLKVFKEWYNNEVYDMVLYDNKGNQIDANYDVIGQENLKTSDVINDNKIILIEDLGIHDNINECISENKEVLRETQAQER